MVKKTKPPPWRKNPDLGPTKPIALRLPEKIWNEAQEYHDGAAAYIVYLFRYFHNRTKGDETNKIS